MKLLTIALGLLLTANVSAAQIESIFLSKDMNQCVRSLDLPYSMHTERIKEDAELLGSGKPRVNVFRNVQRMIRGAGLENTGCAKDVMAFSEAANDFYQDFGVYCVFGSRKGTEARNRMNHFEKQDQFMVCGL